ncbi:MAG: hypothetical protein KC425_09700, partial [Anaerolineales bacterium]|nr:hypothetical protein [Anaerolineales bacterium]
LSLGEARKRLTGRQSDLRVCGWRQLRNLLHDGEGVFWHRHNGRLWLRSVVKVAAALHVWRLNSRPVALPVSVLTQRIGQVRAHLYASFHSGRTQAPTRPIARATLHDLTAVLPRTQRRYEKQARVHAQANYALGPRLDTPAAETAAWRQGSAAFALTDGTGRQGPARTTYLAWQLPNAYEGPHAPLSRSRQKWLNRALTDLLMQGTTGNGERAVAARPARRFFGSGKTAVQASPHAAGQPVYWPAPPQGAAHFWYATQHPGYGLTRIGTE